MKNLRTIILAAGKGVRMKSQRPKVLHEICGQPMIRYILDIAKSLGSLKTCIVLGHKSDAVKDHLDKDIAVVTQKKTLGTADAVKCASSHFRRFSGDVLVLCGDTPLLRRETVKALIVKHRKTKAACTFMTSVLHDPHGYGRVIRDDRGAVIAIREDKDASAFEKHIAEVNAGVYCFRNDALFKTIQEVKLNRKKKEFYLTDIITLLVEKKLKVETFEAEDVHEALGVNTREDLAKSVAILNQRILKALMQDGVTVIDPKTTYIDSNVKIGHDTIIRPFTVIESNVRVGRRCVIGPFCRIRSGVRIGQQVELGNFTEVSRTKIGDRALIKHFSFLGDSTIGSRVNIGAGVVTANFDGENKHQTRIHDGAFIGSDSILVAPVRVGKKAVTGAGTVVTRGQVIPERGVAVGVPAKISSRRNKT